MTAPKRLLTTETLFLVLGWVVSLILIACSRSPMNTQETPAQAISTNEILTNTSQPSTDQPTSTTRSYPTLMPISENEMLRNPHFEGGIDGWDVRFGSFIQSTDASHTGLASGRLITSEVDVRGDYSALVAQCVPMPTDVAALAADGYVRFEVAIYVNATDGGTYISLSGVLSAGEQCRGDQVGTFAMQPPENSDGWMLIEGVIDVPPGAHSLDLLISCSGSGPDSSILLDDVHLAPVQGP